MPRKGGVPENLVNWEKGQSGNPKGRPPLLVSKVNKELAAAGYERVTASQVAEAYETLLNLPDAELEAMQHNGKMPKLIRIMAKEMLGGKGFEVIEKMLDRAHGKAKQTTALTGADGKDLITGITVVIKNG